MEWLYLRHCKLPFKQGEFTWSICPFFGSLLRTARTRNDTGAIPAKVSDALKYCHNPYSCRPNLREPSTPACSKQTLAKLNRMHRVLERLGSGQFFASRCYANIRCEIFMDTNHAMAAIRGLPSEKDYSHRLCLQRTLLAVKTSKSFKQNGVLFVGSLLPTPDMHAWIIEDGCQPDANDRQWILFRPMLALYYL
jgi:hypothetical protein